MFGVAIGCYAMVFSALYMWAALDHMVKQKWTWRRKRVKMFLCDIFAIGGALASFLGGFCLMVQEMARLF